MSFPHEARSEASRPRGVFGGADATPTSVNPFVGYDTNLDYGYLGRSHGFPFGPVLFVPRSAVFGPDLPQVFPVWFFPARGRRFSVLPLSLFFVDAPASRLGPDLFCFRFTGDLYRVFAF